MTPAAREWLVGLRRFSEEHRAAQDPLAASVPSETDSTRPDRAVRASPAALAAQAGIIAEHARAWAIPEIQRLAAARKEVGIVATTSSPGIEAVGGLIAQLPESIRERVAIVTELEYRFWCMRSPDQSHRLHVTLWTWLKAPLPPQRRREYARHPIPPTASYWLLRYGFAGHGDEWRSADLYAWDDCVATLLERGVSERFHSRD
jgi:hypothetical protein